MTDTEKKLVCGGEGAWKIIPFAQVRFNVTNFLQSRGYLHPQFTIERRTDGEWMDIDVGEPTRVTGLTARGAPESLRLYRKRKVVGQILTPALLGTVEQWVTQRLGALGYPCPDVTARADSSTGEIIVEVEPGAPRKLTSVFEEPLPGVSQGMIRRYDAFGLGELYDGDLMTVTMNRIIGINLVQATYFTTSCPTKSTEQPPAGAGISVQQQIVAGPPRLLTFGVGIDTEGALQLRSTWRHARVGNHASLAQASVQLSKIDQQINAFFNWYHFPFPSRRYLQPSYRLQHQNTNAYEIVSTRAGLAVATTWDRGPIGAQVSAGPMIELVRTLRGSGVQDPNSGFLELEATLRVQSHDFEYWATDPRSGFSSALVADLAGDGLGSKTSAQRLSLSGEVLFNFRDYDPPLLIFGLRGAIETTLSPERPGAASRLPANFFWYLGGSTDLRGFPLQSLPRLGAMTAFFLDPELRFADLGLFGVQPFVFWDLGLTGLTPLAFDSPLLHSPGMGLRYKAPFGVFRTTLARGFPLDTPGGWNFYFSFGEEF